MEVKCPYCNTQAEKVTGNIMYPHREDLYHLLFWRCVPCNAQVGTHKGSDGIPFGKLANKEDRLARQLAHTRFDALWKFGRIPHRGTAYSMLAEHMGMTKEECHIGNFNQEQCKKVQEFCDKWNKTENKPYYTFS